MVRSTSAHYSCREFHKAQAKGDTPPSPTQHPNTPQAPHAHAGKQFWSMLSCSHSPADTVLSVLLTVVVVGASAAVSAVVVVVAVIVSVASAVTLDTLDIVAKKAIRRKASQL